MPVAEVVATPAADRRAGEAKGEAVGEAVTELALRTCRNASFPAALLLAGIEVLAELPILDRAAAGCPFACCPVAASFDTPGARRLAAVLVRGAPATGGVALLLSASLLEPRSDSFRLIADSEDEEVW